MRKIVIALLCVVGVMALGVGLWWFVNKNYMSYRQFAEYTPSIDSQIWYTDNAFVEQNSLGVNVYAVELDGNILPLYTDTASSKVEYAKDDYIVLSTSGGVSAFYVGDTLTKAFDVIGEFMSAHQFGEYLCIKVDDGGDIVNYRYDPANGVVNLTQKYDVDFLDYCIDPIENKEYFISYILSGEYVRISIITCNNGVLLPEAFIELDNTVYTGFDYIKDLFVFYTENSMIFVNTQTQVRRVQYVYGVDKVQKISYDDKFVFFMDGAYFNGVDNAYIVTPSSSSFSHMVGYKHFNKCGEKLFYVQDKYAMQHTFGGVLSTDTVLFSDEEMTGISVMGDIIVVEKADKLVFMLAEDK